MAINTPQDRRAISGIPWPVLIPGVTPAAAKDKKWRYESAWGYSGFELVVEPQQGIVVTFQAERTVGIFQVELTVRVFLPDDNDVRVIL